MEIVKLHCLGNDYLVAGPEAQQYSLPALAGALCRSRHGAGGDGLIVLSPGPPGRRRLEVFNDLGVRVEPGASALRSAAFLLGDGSWELDTGSGLQRVDVQGNSTILWFSPPVYGGAYQIGRDFHGYLVYLGQRYFVTFVHSVNELSLDFHGQALDRYFGGISVVFVQERRIRIWQQGREIPGCGLAACAAAAVLWRLGKGQEPLQLDMAGGTVIMTPDRQGRIMQQAAVERVLNAQVDCAQLETV